MLNQTFRMMLSKASLSGLLGIALLVSSTVAVQAQDIQQIRWKNEAQVQSILGEPQTKTAPVGTHATYTLWKYNGYVVAFANGSAFHLFRTDGRNNMELEENRPDSEGA